MTLDISNSDDVIDSRDVIARIEELQDERNSYALDVENKGEDHVDGEAGAKKALAEWDAENGAELKTLLALQEEAEGYAPDWRHGASLIRDSYFTDYAEELIKDIGDLPRDIPHYISIDWEKTAENIKVDYTSVEYDGVTYWVR
jgi:hypothetical protein